MREAQRLKRPPTPIATTGQAGRQPPRGASLEWATVPLLAARTVLGLECSGRWADRPAEDSAVSKAVAAEHSARRTAGGKAAAGRIAVDRAAVDRAAVDRMAAGTAARQPCARRGRTRARR